MADVNFNSSATQVNRLVPRGNPAPANPESRAAQTPAAQNAAFNRDQFRVSGPAATPATGLDSEVERVGRELGAAYGEALRRSGQG